MFKIVLLVLVLGLNSLGAQERETEAQNRAEQSLKEGNWENAAILFESLLQNDGENGKNWFNHGTALLQLKSYERAETAFSRSLELGFNRNQSMIQLAKIAAHRQQGRAVLDWLPKLLAAGINPYNLVTKSREFDFLKNDPEFILLLDKMGRGCGDSQKSRQFDFWIGSWQVTAGGQVVGENRIVPLMNGCVLLENWVGSSGPNGCSLNYYNPTSDLWHQYWVWQNGTTLPPLSGTYKDGKMVLEGETAGPNDGITRHRISWFHNPDGTVRQHWETTTDQGQTWNSLFDGLYTKIDP